MSSNVIYIIIGTVVLAVWWQLTTLKDKVIVSYTRPSGQEIVKLVKLSSNKVYFDNLEFTVLPERHKIRWYKLLWGLLGNIGTWVIAYEFTHDSEFPRDPRTYQNIVVNAEARRSMNNAGSFIAYNRSVDKQTGRKKGLSEWMPTIILGLVVLIGMYYLYTLHQQDDTNIKSIMDAIRLMNK